VRILDCDALGRLNVLIFELVEFFQCQLKAVRMGFAFLDLLGRDDYFKKTGEVVCV